uniref:NADH-ubiquinone oxidoreductase chain 2 n=1 Tax=Nyctimene aello TaxID=270783 RepID=NU2M_NYCAE|nr:RecName: Full=NADH-ubiquinone oxidoreductase chain 2; AltName: Full=NADH dehydrogenase subunit 2 [Nyctimene aello]AAS91452.1 NADH dehydrogenase subunit 2 [Nyctimene aello]
MNPLIFTMILLTVMLGTAIVMTTSHWVMAWIGFEMNMLAIIPILMKKYNPRSMEASTKYFLTQATASMLLMLAIVINLTYSGQWSMTKPLNSTASIIMTLAMAMKLGLAPFHFWVPEVTQGVQLSSGLILLTWQKLAPMSILYQISPTINLDLLLLMSILSILVGGWGGLNQTQLRKILAYSSIAHMGWMTAIMVYNPTMALLNLAIYILLTTTTFVMLMVDSSTTTLSLSHMWNKMPLLTTAILTIMLSLGGLPPLSGFTPKWMIIQEMTKNDSMITPTIMAVMTLLNLYFYMRLTYSTSLTMFPSTNNMKVKWQFNNKKLTANLSPLIILSTLILPLSPMLALLE